MVPSKALIYLYTVIAITTIYTVRPSSPSAITLCNGGKYFIGGGAGNYSRLFVGFERTIAGGGNTYDNMTWSRCAKLCGGCIGFSWDTITHACIIFGGISLGGRRNAPLHVHTYARFHGFFLVNHGGPQVNRTWEQARAACLANGGELSEFPVHAHNSHVLMGQTTSQISSFIGVYRKDSTGDFYRMPFDEFFEAKRASADHQYMIFDGGHKTISADEVFTLPSLCWKP